MATPLDRRIAAAGRPLFVPLGTQLACRLEQVEWAELAADPALASFTLRAARDALGADAMVAAFDGWAEAEAAGRAVCRDALGAVTEAGPALASPPDAAKAVAAPPLANAIALAGRLVAEAGETASVLGVATGPSTLLARLAGGTADAAWIEAAAALMAKAVDGLCRAGVAAVVLAEDEPVADPALYARFDAAFNLARYYQVPVLVLARHPLSEAAREAAHAAGASWAVGPGEADGDVASVPLEAFAGEGAAGWTAPAGGPARLFVSAWALPPETAPEAVVAVRRALCG